MEAAFQGFFFVTLDTGDLKFLLISCEEACYTHMRPKRAMNFLLGFF
jgi:hypothetical protein